MSRDYKSKARWWKAKKMRPVFCAEASSKLSPKEVNITEVGHHVSLGFRSGWRTYSFATARHRDRFVELYARYGAKVCADPAV